MSNTWSPTALAAIEGAYEIEIAANRPDGTVRDLRIVWHVVVDGNLFLRSVRGNDGAWYRGVMRTQTGVLEANGTRYEVTFTPDASADVAIDAGYRAKYGGGSPVRAITSDVARATTLRVDPR